MSNMSCLSVLGVLPPYTSILLHHPILHILASLPIHPTRIAMSTPMQIIDQGDDNPTEMKCEIKHLDEEEEASSGNTFFIERKEEKPPFQEDWWKQYAFCQVRGVRTRAHQRSTRRRCSSMQSR